MTIKPIPEERELLAKIASGDEHAFRVLFESYYHNLGKYVYQLTGSIAVAEEIVQDTFIKVWLKREFLVEVKNFSNYLFILCRNHTYNEMQKKATERNFIDRLSHRINDQQNNENPDTLSERYRELVEQAIEKLPPQAQKVYLMSRDERMKYEEIAQALKISPVTVKKHIQYANKFIAAELSSKLNLAIVGVLMTTLILS
ncbi:RNA polymerase sigma-70 factor, ECF subfamily [Pedobacter sp. ok626]|uniref:RNA polymerase sigma factor n=1 Tax=Pedobacter sp. ok626 TaxID=1761882 RepID=UPI000882E666|nr:RNA polymerase sigma-70 factor [Pedobacter sp. ok626]SDJ51472.1 RNA polymerase sigma-70 factor, ECF subfamily [Pedobacter sp. ok626]